MRTVFLRVLEELDDKEAALRVASVQSDASRNRQYFDVDPATFGTVPGSPFAYWVSDRVRALFSHLQMLEAPDRAARIGLSTSDDFRFVRGWWAIANGRIGSRWQLFAKGGIHSPFYADIYLLLQWERNGAEMKAWVVANPTDPRTTHWSRRIANPEYFYRPGITWPLRTKSDLSMRLLPAGCLFGHKGPAIFNSHDDVQSLLALLSVCNSRGFRALVGFQLAAADARRGGAAHSYEVGVLQRTPVPALSASDGAALALCAKRAWSLKWCIEMATETSHAFVRPVLLQLYGATLAASASLWNARIRSVEAELTAIQAEIDERCFGLYGIDEDDRRAITEGFGAGGSDPAETDADRDGDEEDEAEAEVGADIAVLAAELVSWAVGVAFGRFDVRLATGERPLPSEPGPFDPLPVCSPGMLTGEDGLPLARPPADYPLSFPEDGILVDDSGHPRDLTAALRSVFEAIFASGADAMWQEASAFLDPRDHDLRHWLVSEFFEHHVRRYSKSRRKAPILWQLGIPSGRYSVWCYAHRMTRDSLLAIQNDVVGPKLATEERRLSSLVTQAGEPPSARERAEIATQKSFVDELRTLADEVTRVAPLWNPDLDDGIVLVLAPLWRLVPTHKAWQKELRTKWDELVAGKYDWAHVAMHLWPDRVVPKCATDRSLAIAHGLEDVFWVEGTDGKWSARKNPTRPNAELVAERTSPAVKAALAALFEAQQPLGAAKRRGRTSQGAS